MPRYRMMYAKEGPARYISHLDLLRAFERAARRAGLPLAFTLGFNPHPKIAFAAPLGVGTAGEREFADLELTANMPPEEVAGALGRALPEGLRLIELRAVADQAGALMTAVDRATYRAEAILSRPVSAGEAERAVAAFLSMPQILVEKKGRRGEKKVRDIKPGILAMSARVNDGIIVVEAELKTGSIGNVRVEEVLDAFTEKSRLPVEGRFLLYRTGVYAARGKEKKSLWHV